MKPIYAGEKLDYQSDTYKVEYSNYCIFWSATYRINSQTKLGE